MNDITYRPFIRDSALGDINIQIPNLEIPVYKPRYSQPLEDDTETEVQSQVEEIRNPEPIVQETTVHKFNSKKDFKDTMLPIYERLLKSKGLNPAFAKSLVAQDGLESAWGSKPAGSYNFGGIKGKGTTKRTREVINGKDVYINDQFRNFKSLEDYANFKIDLLNNKRYKAFSGDIKEFANRVHRGGYATDPRYANILNQVIASAKHGGVLKFQQGGIQEGKQWLEDWYKSRKGLVKQNVKQVLPIPLPVTESLVFNALKRNLDLTRAKINPSKVPDNASGVYYPFGRRIFLTDGSTSTAIHEWTHSSLPDAQEKVIKKYQDNFGDTVYDNKTIVPDEYLDNPQEIYTRLMQLRYSINADPNHKFTKEEIQNIKKEHLDHYTLTNRLKNSEGKGSFSVSQFDKDGKIIQSEPFNPEYKIVPEESTVTPHYKEENTYNVLNRYSDDFLLHLFNNVAQAPTKKKDVTLYAQSGLKIPKYQEPWNVLPEQMQFKPFDPNWKSPLIEIPSKQKYIPTIKDLATKFTSGFEGFKEFPYYLNNQELIGFGFADKNIINKYRETGISQSEGLKLLESELQKHWDALNKEFPTFKNLDPNIQLALTELSYNTHGITEFSEKRSPKLRKMLLDGVTDPNLLIKEMNHDASKDNWTGVRSSGRRAMALGEYDWFPERVDKLGRTLIKDAEVGPRDWESSPYYKKY